MSLKGVFGGQAVQPPTFKTTAQTTMLPPGHGHILREGFNRAGCPSDKVGEELRRLEQIQAFQQKQELKNHHNNDPTPLGMIAMRLHIKAGMRIQLDYIEAYVSADKAYVFIVNKKQPLIIEDEVGLFPSDALITKLRLIMDEVPA